MTLYGLDLSNHQKGIDIASHSPGFVIAKATDGTRFVDPTCAGFLRQCDQTGILTGVYHFANSPRKSSMKAQARYFVDHIRSYIGQSLLCLDWEDSLEIYGGSVIKWGPAYAKEWLDEVTRLTGVRPVIYMSAYVTTSYDWREVAKEYALWGAGYTGYATYRNPCTDHYRWGPWRRPLIHQYSSSNGLDKNIGYLSRDEWIELCKSDKEDKKHGLSHAYSQALKAKQIIGSLPENLPVLHLLDKMVGRPSADEALMRDVLDGKFGVGDQRKENLGPYYNQIQNLVNDKLKER